MQHPNSPPLNWNERLVRFADLIPCTNAFIDARSPGSNMKENFTIIGPGVAENPNQYVHIREPHGFNVGGARQPPHCTNSLHSHDTAEVFMIHTGTWRFFWGEHGDAGEVVVRPGDTISIPVHVFRGFENIGADTGFMFSLLGGDDPGRVHWAPHVIDKARGHGLVLLENGTLIDTTEGETVPPGAQPVTPSTREQLAYIRTPSAGEMQRRIVSANATGTAHGGLRRDGVNEIPVIGAASVDGIEAAPIEDAHGFTLRRLDLRAGASVPMHRRTCAEVLIVQRGALTVEDAAGARIKLNRGDTLTIPRDTGRALKNEGTDPLSVLVARSGEDPGAPEWS